jgi:L-seryl-tRNA(Ser) seleniumtransferase
LGLYGRESVRVQARHELDLLRRSADTLEDETFAKRLEELPQRIEAGLDKALGGLRPVLNATGIFLHTNLGRAPLPRPLLPEITRILGGYCDLELELESGRRSERNRHVKLLLERLCGAPAALVTNNNAAALVLTLETLARGREVIVARGELVEIGGSFRIPEILEAAGARLREVGATNRVHLDDYRRALSADTALLLKVHPSNYKIRGFVAEVAFAGFPSCSELLAAGVDLVASSGDKWLGGPQAGLLLGRADLIARCLKSPLYRALRPDRYTYAALEAVLRWQLAGKALPIERLWPEPNAHRARLEGLIAALGLGEIVEAPAFVGAGTAADQPIHGLALGLPADEALTRKLRLGSRGRSRELPALLTYSHKGRMIVDLRTIDPEDDALLVRVLRRGLQAGEP